MNTLYKVLGIIVLVGTIVGSVGGTVYHFDKVKVDKEQYKAYVAFTDIRFLEQHRRDLQEHVRWMERNYPNRYRQMPEYQRLIEQIKQVTVKINAFYSRGK